MSTTIPYDPALSLGSIVHPERLAILEKMGQEQAPVDAALLALNASITLKNKLDMTERELINLNITPSKNLKKEIVATGTQISKAAENYAAVSVKHIPAVQALQSKIPVITKSIESPIDFNRSVIKQLPLSSDSLTMDSQYFSFDGNEQQSASSMDALKSFVSASFSFLGDKVQSQATAAAEAQVNKQREHHNIQGTLVISANCTHKQSSLFAPFYIDVDKGIRAWNEIFPSDMINPQNKASMLAILKDQNSKKEQLFNLISGATFGSSFVGMVHILKSEDSSSSQKVASLADSLQTAAETGCWLASEKGGVGLDSSISNSIKHLLSQQEISAHVSLVTMGVIPSIVANDVKMVVKEFANFSPDQQMSELATLQNATASEQGSVAQAAEKARTGGLMASLESTKITSVMSAVQKGEEETNKVLDINSLMTAFEDYINKAIEGNAGVPINYFLKPITRSLLAQMWVSKYFPKRYVTSAGDDSAASDASSAQPASDGGDN